MDRDEINRRFRYHQPDEAKARMHNDLRDQFLGMAVNLDAALPGESREKSLAMTALEEASFWAHAHIARNIKNQEAR